MTHDDHHDENDSTRSRRVDALHALSQRLDDSAPTTQPPSALAPKRRFSWRWRLLAALMLIALIVAGSAVYLALRPHDSTAKKQPVKPVVIQPAADGMFCWNYVTWSPDSARIALFGHRQNCDGAPLLNIYDARTSKLATQLEPATLLAKALPQAGASIVYFSDIAWSPDGQRLALVFGAHGASSSSKMIVGVLLTDTAGQHVEVAARETADESPILHGVADLTQHTVSATPALPPALGYRWGANGALDSETPLSASAPPAQVTPGPVGSPNGDRFTIWQPGWLDEQTTDPTTGQVYNPGVYTWYSTFLAWSPDGRYLRQLSLSGRLAPADGKQPSGATLKALNQEKSPILPVRDNGLKQVIDILTQNARNSLGTAGALQSVAWRPDGKYLATQTIATNPNGDDSAESHQVVVYECATGAIWGILHPETRNAAGGSTQWLRWSPNGTRILVSDPSLGALTIWGPEMLPR